MYRYLLIVCLLTTVILTIQSCRGDKEKVDAEQREAVVVPVFQADSAYYFIQQQVDFGPRIPNTRAHRETGDFLVDRLRQYGASVTEQQFKANAYDGQQLALRNIIGSFFNDKSKRILLAAHWDTRPFADKDKENSQAMFDGANDGGSGVGVLLEVARILSSAQPEVGVDIIFFDGEDWGEHAKRSKNTPLPPGLESWWCLGSQHWAKNKHKPNYAAYYGILLDMVGARDARFPREGFSLLYAPSVVEKVWDTAEQLGYSRYFVKKNVGEITDDHLFINQLGKIPMIDIVQLDPTTQVFGSYHHTRADNMEIISKETLQAVGQTLLHVLFHEAP